jgi:hypothetical protein
MQLAIVTINFFVLALNEPEGTELSLFTHKVRAAPAGKERGFRCLDLWRLRE